MGNQIFEKDKRLKELEESLEIQRREIEWEKLQIDHFKKSISATKQNKSADRRSWCIDFALASPHEMNDSPKNLKTMTSTR